MFVASKEARGWLQISEHMYLFFSVFSAHILTTSHWHHLRQWYIFTWVQCLGQSSWVPCSWALWSDDRHYHRFWPLNSSLRNDGCPHPLSTSSTPTYVGPPRPPSALISSWDDARKRPHSGDLNRRLAVKLFDPKSVTQVRVVLACNMTNTSNSGQV